MNWPDEADLTGPYGISFVLGHCWLRNRTRNLLVILEDGKSFKNICQMS